MKKSNKWTIISGIFFAVQLVAELVITVSVLRLNMLPIEYTASLIAVMILLLVITASLSFLRIEKKHTAIKVIRRGISYIVAVAVAVACVPVGGILGQVNNTIESVTAPKAPGTLIGVYVLKDDPAQNVNDAENYKFGVYGAYDGENVEAAVGDIETRLNHGIDRSDYANAMEMAAALYSKEVGAIIINEAFASLFDDQEEFAGFSEDTRLIYEYAVEGGEDEQPDTDAPQEPINKRPFLVYISGLDTRSEMLSTSRSDVNIIAAVNPVTKQVLLVNTPRDYYVPISVGGGANDKLTHCGIYGIQCSVDTLSAFYGEDIEYYAQINFTGLERLVDAVDGITVYSDFEFGEFKEGANLLNGKQALAFARDRYSFASGDNQRGKNQMKVINAIINKMSGGAALANVTDILDSLKGMFTTNVSAAEISLLVKMQISDGSKWQVFNYAVTGTGGSDVTYTMPYYNAYVMYPDTETVEHAAELIDRIMAGDELSESDI